MKTTNKTILNLNCVQHGTLWYENQYGHRRQEEPKGYTYLGNSIPHCIVNVSNSHKMDRWRPVVVFQLTANHSICYYGQKGLDMWKAWCAKIFSKQMKQEQKNK